MSKAISLLLLPLLLLLPSLPPAASDHVIDDYGAVRNNASAAAARANGIALFNAITAASSGVNGSRTAVVPLGGDFYFVPHLPFDGVADLELRLDGTLLA